MLILLLVLGLGVFLFFNRSAWQAEDRPRVDIMRAEEVVGTFHVELATTMEELVQGLMGREHLPEGTGMLFIFPQPDYYGMWMPNMLIALDFLFIDEHGRVVHVERDIQPCPEDGPCPTIAASTPIKYVLEIPAGTIARLGLRAGDSIRLSGAEL